MMKWLLTVGVFIGVLALSAGLVLIVGCCMVPSLDEGSHGLAVPLMLGILIEGGHLIAMTHATECVRFIESTLRNPKAADRRADNLEGFIPW